MKLKLNPNIARPDEIYAALLKVHEGLSAEASARLNFRLILILMNHIGDEDVVREAMDEAARNSQT